MLKYHDKSIFIFRSKIHRANYKYAFVMVGFVPYLFLFVLDRCCCHRSGAATSLQFFTKQKNFSKIPVRSFFIFVYVVYRNYTIASKRKKLVGAFFIVFKDYSFNVFFLPTFTRPSPRRKNRSYIRTYVPKSMNKMIKVYVRTNSNLI